MSILCFTFTHLVKVTGIKHQKWIFFNDTDIYEEDTHDQEQTESDQYPRQDAQKFDYTEITSNQVRKKKSILFTDEKWNKAKKYHILISDQDCKTLEDKIEYT